MSLVAETLYVEKFDIELGAARLENKVQKGEDVPEPHLRAYRLAREEVCYTWLKCVAQIIQSYFVTTGKFIDPARLFQYRFPEQLWDNIETFLENLGAMPLWVNRELSLSVFGGKQNYQYWQEVFSTGKSPQGQPVLAEPVNFMKMIQKPGQPVADLALA